jgi:hypothetical protein
MSTRADRSTLVGVSLPLTRAVRAQLAGRLTANGLVQRLPNVVGGLPGQPAGSYQPTTPAITVEVEVERRD